MRHRGATLCFAVLLVTIPFTMQGEDALSSDAAIAQTQCDKILADYRAEEAKLDERIKRVERSQWKGLVAEFHPIATRDAQQLLETARQHPHTPAAIQALVWITTQLRIDLATRAQALGLLRADYADSDGLRDVFTAISRTYLPGSETFLRAVLAKNPQQITRTWACFYLASFLQGQGREKEAAETYEHFLAEYGDVAVYPNSTLRKDAEDALFAIRRLAVGQVAPEIEGTNVDGQPFKLSDYRGKVVMLDFWGRW